MHNAIFFEILKQLIVGIKSIKGRLGLGPSIALNSTKLFDDQLVNAQQR